MRKPFFWKARGGWYVKSGQSQVRLADTEEDAYKVWRELMVAEHPESAAAPLWSVVDNYLEHAKITVAEETYSRIAYYLADLCNELADLPARELKPGQVTQWLASHAAWGPWSQRGAISAIKRCFNWAVTEGHLPKNPLAALRRPAAERRQRLITDAEHATMVAGCTHNGTESLRTAVFRQVLIALKHSGSRPGMVARVTAGNISPAGDAWVFGQHKTLQQTGRPIVIYLTPCLQTLTRIMVAAGRKDRLFLNSESEPWTRNAIRCRVRSLRNRLKLDATIKAYSYRHSFVTQALLNGADVATVAQLLGHSDTSMISRHYGHLDQASEHLKAAAAKAVKRRA